MEFALQDDAVFVDQRWMARDKALEHAAELGTKRIRVNILWARTLVSGAEHRTPPANGAQYDFSRIDALQAAAAARGIKLQLTVTGPAPAWATKDRKVGANQPDPVKFGAFVRTVAAHFKGRVDRYSVWNEPNLSAWLAPTQDRAEAVPQPLQGRLHRDQDRRPELEGAVRRARPEPRRPHDRPAEVPPRGRAQERQAQGRRPRASPLPVHGRADEAQPAAPTTRRSASSRA